MADGQRAGERTRDARQTGASGRLWKPAIS